MMIREFDREEYKHVLVCGDLYGPDAAMLGDVLRRHADAGIDHILVEFGNRVVVSSATIGLFISLQRLLGLTGGELVLVRPPPQLVRSLGILGVSLFRVEDSVSDAVRGAHSAA